MEKPNTTPTDTKKEHIEQGVVGDSKEIAATQTGVREGIWPPHHLSPPNIVSYEDVGGRRLVRVEKDPGCSGPKIDFNHRVVIEERGRELH